MIFAYNFFDKTERIPGKSFFFSKMNIKELVESMRKDKIQPGNQSKITCLYKQILDSRLYRLLILAYSSHKNWQAAIKIFFEMEKQKIPWTYGHLR